MPQVAAAAAAALISAAGATGVTAAIITAGVNIAFAAATQAIISAVTQAITKPDVAAAEGRPTEWSADPNAPIPFVMGRRGVSGVIVHRDTYGANNRYLANVTVYSGGGPINAYGDFLVDGAAVTFTGEAMDGSPAGRLYRQTKTGAQPDTALTSPTVSPSASLSDWGSSHKLSGYACSMITLQQDGDFKYWPAGIPRTLQEIQGILAWDPRLDSTWPGGSGSCRLATPSTWVYTQNPIIHALKWALGIKHNGVLVGGIGASVDGIDVTSFIAAANIADTNSWTVSAVAYSDAPSGDDKYQVLEALLQAGGAVPSRKAGTISCVSRAANPSSVVTITAADTAGPFEFRAGAPREGRINTIIPRCVQETHEWEMVDLEPVIGTSYVTEDGGATRSRGATYAYVADADQAAQLAAYDIADSREGITGTITLKPYLRDLEPGDAFTINEDGFALSSQKCLVLSRSYDPGRDVVTVTFRSETAAKHAWALGITGTAPTSPTLGTVDPATVPTPSGSNWSLAAGTGGTPSIVLTGAVPTSVMVSRIVVEYRVDGTSDWIAFGEFASGSTNVDVTGLLAATAYELAVSYRNTFNALGSRLELGPVTTAGNVATEINPTAEIVSGTGDTALRISNGQLWVGEGGVENAVAVLDSNGLIQSINDPNISFGGLKYFDSNGATPAFFQQIAAENRTSLPATRVVQALVPHAASSGAIASYLTTTLMAASSVQLDVSFSLASFSTSTSDFPSTITVTLYEQYSTDNGGSWSTLTAVSGGTKTLTKITSGTPTSSQYLVEQGSYRKFDGSDLLSETYYRVTNPAALSFTVSATSRAEAMWRWSLVGPTGAAWRLASSTITATDTDDKPSFLVGSVSAGSSTPWANPVGHSHELVIQNTTSTDIEVTASAITISSASGAVRTVRSANLTLDINASGIGGLDTGTMTATTQYAIYLISDGTDAGDALICSTSFSAPTMPSGYSYVGRIGAFFTGGGPTVIDFIKRGNRFRYRRTASWALQTVKSGSHGNVTTPTYVTTSYSPEVPSTAVEVTLLVFVVGGSTIISPSTSYGGYSNTSNPPYSCFSPGANESFIVDIPNEDGNVYSASNNSFTLLLLSGYVDSV